jgi:hypothetical protein
MSREDLKTLAWLGPLAFVLSFWWLFRANPCLDDEMGNLLSNRRLPSGSGATGLVQQTYGFVACDHWPSTAEQVTTLTMLASVVLLIGGLGGWLLTRSPIRRATAIVAAAVFSMLAFSQLVYLPRMLSFGDPLGFSMLSAELMGSGVILAAATLLAALSAWLMVEVRTRIKNR